MAPLLLLLLLLPLLFVFALLLFLAKPKKSAPPAPTTKSAPARNSELDALFSTFDGDGDGFITLDELKDSLRRLRLAAGEEEARKMMERVDVNGDGLIDAGEFRRLCESLEGRVAAACEGEGEEELREAFEVFDGNGDGEITVEELGAVLAAMGLRRAGVGRGECEDMIRRVDLDGDGKVSFEEFKKMMRGKNGKLL